MSPKYGVENQFWIWVADLFLYLRVSPSGIIDCPAVMYKIVASPALVNKYKLERKLTLNWVRFESVISQSHNSLTTLLSETAGENRGKTLAHILDIDKLVPFGHPKYVSF